MWNTHTAEFKLRGFEEPSRETEGTMLNIRGILHNYLENSHDMCCKYDNNSMEKINVA